MGNKTKPDKPWHNVSPGRMVDPGTGGDGPEVDVVPGPETWTVTLEDLTAHSDRLLPMTGVRATWKAVRFSVHAGENLVGFVSTADSATIRASQAASGGVIQGTVVRIDRYARTADVELRLEVP
jgi:hypothetical protein